ncbi:MAG TPA: XdhC family protein [Thermoanaerobaculia bacterium]|nr:XdhC family protein [Thermoanaerobaculia bacterium]
MKHWKETAEVFGRLVRLPVEGRRAALATVVAIEGSAYRRPGAKLLVEEDGRTLGSISGGCLEGDVREVARGVLAEGRPRRRRYETGADENAAWGLGLGCAGSVELLVQPVTPSLAQAAERCLELFEEGRPFALCTPLDDDAASAAPVVVSADGSASGSTGEAPLDGEIASCAAAWIASRDSRRRHAGGAEVFAEILVPAPRLLLFGADDDARPICAFASAAGFRVTVVDHREAFLAAERFPEAERRVARRPEEGVGGLPVGPRTFAVVKTHLIAHDREWARRLLDGGTAYVGLLGPRARTREIVRSIGAEGDGRVFGPVGLDLGAEGPEQVALAIVAELLAAGSGVDPRHLREKAEEIHVR